MEPHVSRRYLTTPLVCEDCGTPAHSSISGGRQGHTMLCDGCREQRGKKPRKTSRSFPATKLMYKGVPVVMSKSDMVDYLTALANGAKRAAADVLMGAMSDGALNKIEWISGTSGGAKSWWAETWDQAWPYTFPQGMHFGRGVGVVPVVMTAEQSESSEVVDEHWYDMGVGKAFKVDEKTELRVVKVEALTPPPKTAAALASRFRSGYREAEWFFDVGEYAKKLGEVSHDMCYLYMSPLPIPVMVTTSSGRQGHTMLFDGCREQRGKKPRKAAAERPADRDEFAAEYAEESAQAWGEIFGEAFSEAEVSVALPGMRKARTFIVSAKGDGWFLRSSPKGFFIFVDLDGGAKMLARPSGLTSGSTVRRDGTPIALPSDVMRAIRAVPFRRESSTALPLAKTAAVDSQAAALAHSIYQSAVKVEPRVSKDMQAFADEQGGKLEGFSHRLKTEESIARKLMSKSRTTIGDALRYTIVLPEDVYALQVQSVIESLRDKGYKEVSVENYWEPGDDYQGINGNWGVPNSDIVLELQFHTSDSLRMKEDVVHRLYEQYRSLPDTNQGKQMLFNVMKRYWDFVKTPRGATNVGSPKNHTPPSDKPVSEWAEINLVTKPQWLRAARLMCMGVERGMQKDAALHRQSLLARQAARKDLPLLDAGQLAGNGIHVASEDYPELGAILWERPDLVEAEPVTSSSTLLSFRSSLQPTVQETPVSIRREAVTPKELRQQTGDPTRSGRVPPSKRTPQWKDGNPTPNYQTAQDIIDDPRSPWWWRKIVGPSVERYERARGLSYDLANTPSMDWCRFRRDSQCYYPKQLDEQATAQAGYPVWKPENRGNCWRIAWSDQKVCPMAEPGPNSREQVVYPDATIPWDQGGQRIPNGARRMGSVTAADYDDELGDCYESAGKFMLHDVRDDADQFRLVHGLVTGQGASVKGVRFGHAWVEYTTESGQVMVIDNSNDVGYYGKRSEYYSVGQIRESELIRYTRPEAMKMMAKFRHWGPWDGMFDKYASLSKTSAWRDVQAKAARIRSNGGVHIIAVTPTSISAEVKGDSNIYLTTITRVPNSKQVALWSCGCDWNTYSWARSGRWKKYEGRMCSHALAVVYQAQSEQMFGGEVGEQRGKPTWRTTEPVSEGRERPGEWRLDVAAALHDHLSALEGWRADILDDGLLTLIEQAERVAQISRSAACARTDLDAVRHSGVLVPGNLVDVAALGSADTLIGVPPFLVDYDGRMAEVVAIDPVNHSCMFSDGEMADIAACTHPSYDPVLGLSATAGIASLGAANTTGVMIALAPSLALAERMAEATRKAGFDAEEAQQLHISLAVLNGDTSTIDRDRLMSAARSIAAQVTPMQGEIAGFGTFANGKSNVLWAAVDVPGIEQLKVAVDGVLATAGLDALSNHGFTPHLTLAYSDDPITTLPTAEGFAGEPLSFTTLVAAYGGEWVHLDLVGNSGDVVAVEKVASSLYADDVDYGKQTVFDASPSQARGDWGYYSREQALRDSGMPGGQVFASVEAAQRYANMVLRDYGIAEPVSVSVMPGVRGESGSQWSIDRTRGRIMLASNHMREDFLLHELAHLIFRKGKGGKGAASHGGGYAGVHAELLHRYMGLGLKLFAAKGNGIDACKYCGSSALWGAHFDADGLYDEHGEWSILCEDCGKFQKRHNPRTATVGQREDFSPPIQWGGQEVYSLTKVDPSKIIDSFTAANGDSLIVWNTGRRKLILDTHLGTINQTFRGVLSWFPNGEIAMVSVNPAYRREGIATRLYELAKQIEPRLHHSSDLTEDGKAWSATVSALQDDVAWLQANGGIAVLNDEPEPALPATEASPAEDMAATDSVSLPADEVNPLDNVDGLTLQSGKAGPLGPGGEALSWLMKGSSSGSGDIAAAAQQFLAKTALKDFNPVEQAEIIAEGESGVRAANLDLLQIEGTHYQALDETAVDDDASFLW